MGFRRRTRDAQTGAVTAGQWARRTARVLALLVVAGVGGGCGRRDGRVVVLGICGLPPQFVDQIVAQGDAPAFARLYREGAIGRIATRAAGLPPVYTHIWTSYVTGQLPAQHGILGFTNLQTKHLLESSDRRVAALWEIA